MRIFQGLIFLIFGVGLLLMVYKSLSFGWLPFGPRGLAGKLEFRREEQPVLFWLLVVTYAVAGLSLVAFAVRLLTGYAVPLPLH